MRHRGKAICPSCPQAHGFLKLQPNAIISRPFPGFAIGENPGCFSNVHFKFHCSIANVAYKRISSYVRVWGILCWQTQLMTALQSPLIICLWTASDSLLGISAQHSSPRCQTEPGVVKEVRKYILAKMKSMANTCSLVGHRLNLTPGTPSFWMEKETVFMVSYFLNFEGGSRLKDLWKHLLISDDVTYRKWVSTLSSPRIWNRLKRKIISSYFLIRIAHPSAGGRTLPAGAFLLAKNLVYIISMVISELFAIKRNSLLLYFSDWSILMKQFKNVKSILWTT